MKILFVNHTFPPESLAGSEIYVLNMALELKKQGHEVIIFYRYADETEDEYLIKKDIFHGLPIYKINHTYRYVARFQDIYINRAIAAKFSHLLHELKPDVVHFNHTTNLSMSLVYEAKMARVPIVYTLHDFWLICQRGQLLRRDLSLCEGPGEATCRSCLSIQLLRGRKQRLLTKMYRLMAGHGNAGNIAYDLRHLRRAKIETPDRQFVGLQSFQLGDSEKETLLSHPPARIEYPLQLPQSAVLKTAVAMHPHTYDREGSGVLFEIARNGELLWQQSIDPKTIPGDRGWHEVEIPLHPSLQKSDRLELRTHALTGDNAFCTAGWRRPVIEWMESPAPEVISQRRKEIKNLIFKASNIVTEAVTAFSGQAREGISHRLNWVNRVFQDVDVFIAPSRFLKERYLRFGLPESKILHSDYGFVVPSSPSRSGVQKPIVFGYLGTWIPSKGLEIALQSFQDIHPDEATFLVYGFFPGGYEGYDNYDAYLRSLAGEAVEFRGKYKPEEVYAILSEFDCLIMPSIWYENSPLTIHEAFLKGVPVLTSDLGGMAELVGQGGGEVFEPRNIEDLREKIEMAIQNPDMIDRWRSTIPRVKSVEDHGEELLGIYTRLLDQVGTIPSRSG